MNTSTQQANGWIGLYGRMRKAYLEEHQPELLRELTRSGRLSQHLVEVDAAARRRLEALMTALARNAGATEALKAQNQLAWVQLMSACKAQAEEIIIEEIIYS
ncbi:MAG: TnpV protein [Clostridia bacterium]|nr:TnpV protein [Clostridia bacterium]